jgi:hypothetical protein
VKHMRHSDTGGPRLERPADAEARSLLTAARLRDGEAAGSGDYSVANIGGGKKSGKCAEVSPGE